jgi:hypothetical protein
MNLAKRNALTPDSSAIVQLRTAVVKLLTAVVKLLTAVVNGCRPMNLAKRNAAAARKALSQVPNVLLI